jgi:DNA-binding NarL/FixJ family response regulator
MTRVAIYERHPAVLEGLRRRLEEEGDMEVVGGYVDLYSFEAALTTLQPDIAIVSAFGGGAIPAANLAVRTARDTKLLALVSGTRRHERLGYPASAEFITDGPRDDLLVERLLRLGRARRQRAAGHTGS